MYIKDPFESKCQLLINGREKVGIYKFKNPKTFIGHSQTIDDVCEILEHYIPSKKGKVFMVLRLNATHYFIMKISNKRELQQIASNHLSDIEFKDFMKLYKDYNKDPYSFLEQYNFAIR